MTIKELKDAIAQAKAKQQEARAECKKLEQDMDDFKNNKDSKLKELKNDIATLKAQLAKQSLVVKTGQKEVQILELELGGLRPKNLSKVILTT